MPFYVGNARCSECGGQGFCPCPLCVGYALDMPRPDPVAGPEPVEDMDLYIDSLSWLKRFPDSRRQPKRAAVTAKRIDPALTANDKDTSDDVDYSVLAYNFYVQRARLKHRG